MLRQAQSIRKRFRPKTSIWKSFPGNIARQFTFGAEIIIDIIGAIGPLVRFKPIFDKTKAHTKPDEAAGRHAAPDNRPWETAIMYDRRASPSRTKRKKRLKRLCAARSGLTCQTRWRRLMPGWRSSRRASAPKSASMWFW
jgi:hypothetical protein